VSNGTVERSATLGRLVVGAATELARPSIGIGYELGRVPIALRPEPVDLLRPDDLLLLRCSFVNLRWGPAEPDGAPTLIRAAGNRPAYLIVRFPSQHIIERAYFETSKDIPVEPAPDPPVVENADEKVQPLPVWASLAGPTALVFRVQQERIRYTTEGILDAMSRLELSVAPNALPPRDNRLVPWRDMIDVGNLDVVLLARRGRSGGGGRRATGRSRAGRSREVDLVSDAVALARASRTALVLERRFGTESALRTIAGTRIGGLIGIDRVIDVGIRRLPKPEPAPPDETQTAIELPWRLIVSPNVHGAWAHSPTAIEHDGRLELWHTRMGTRGTAPDGTPIVLETPQRERAIRAIWARDFDELGSSFPYKTRPNAATDFPRANSLDDRPLGRTSLNSRDRMMLVHETANFKLTRNQAAWNPPAVPVERLMLSTMGGWLESRVMIPSLPDPPFSIEEWKHVAAMGRDHEVKVVYAGYLLPFGHRASLVKVTERKIKPAPDGRLVAYLFQRMFIIVREPEKQFGSTPALSGGVRPDLAMPLATVRILTRVTPDLDPPGELPDDPNDDALTLFVPYVANAAFPFKILAVDREGNAAEFRAPLAFIERSRTRPISTLSGALDAYNKLKSDRRMPLNGQRLAFAESQTADDTILTTDGLTFDAKILAKLPANVDDVAFLPTLNKADVVVPAMSALAGANQVVALDYPIDYLKRGFTDNTAQVFFQVKDGLSTALEFAGQSNRSGGFVTPSLNVTGLSRLTGPIGGNIADAIGTASSIGQFKPDQFFAGVGARLFGVVKLSDLLKQLPFDPDNVPSFVGQALDLATTLADNARRLMLAVDQVEATIGNTATQLKAELATFASDFAAFTGNPSGAINKNKVEADLLAIKARLDQILPELEAATSLPRAQLEQALGLVRRLQDQLATVNQAVAFIERLAKGELLPEVVSARLDWSTQIPRYKLGAPTTPVPSVADAIISPVNAAGAPIENATLTLAVDLQAPTAPGKDPSALVSCSISAIDLQLIAPETFLVLHFKKFEFSLVPGKKPDVNVVLADNAIEFKGPLKFVETLKDVIPFDGFSDPPFLDVTAEGIEAGFTMAIPNLSVGIFSLENISIGAKLKVPFIDDSLQVGFNFCTRENPFRLSVMLFAGGGFVGVTVTPAGVKVLEAALEFGAAISVNFGVASGSLSAMAGIYFKIETTANGEECTLTGYFRLRGEVDVLGLISASIELYLALSYESATNKAVGQATLTIEVEVAFFSTSVKISAEKRFAGSGADPTFLQQMGLRPGAPAGEPRPWDVYARAFA
jgi:hypothetical protein